MEEKRVERTALSTAEAHKDSSWNSSSSSNFYLATHRTFPLLWALFSPRENQDTSATHKGLLQRLWCADSQGPLSC